MSAISILAIAVCLSAEPEAYPSATIVGDVRLLNMVAEKMGTSRRSFPTGRMRFTVTETPLRNGRRERDVCIGEVSWAGSHQRWRYDISGTEIATNKTPRQQIGTCVIETPTELISHWTETKQLFHYRDKQKSVLGITRVSPADAWFNVPGTRFQYAKYLDKDFVPPVLKQIEVEQPDRDTVVVRRVNKTEGGIVLTFSLSQGGNLTRYEQMPRRTRIKGRDHNGHLGEYAWVPTRDGGWRLGSLRFTDYEDNVENDVFTRDLTVTEFESPVGFEADYFTLAGLRAPEGTKVEERARGQTRRYTIGKKDQVGETELDESAN